MVMLGKIMGFQFPPTEFCFELVLLIDPPSTSPGPILCVAVWVVWQSIAHEG
jgi:hypothetical protein